MSYDSSLNRSKVAIRAVSVFSSQGPRPELENHVLIQEEKGIFVLADGFGGPIPGHQAAKTACEATQGYLCKEAGDEDATFPFELRSYFSLSGNVLFNSLIHANQRVMKLNEGKNVHEKGGASVLAGFIDHDLLALANVGNCTAWLIRDGQAVEMTSPRSYGRLLDPFCQDVPLERRVPLMALGMSKDLEPEICEFRVQKGDWILIHTEGLEKSLRDQIFLIQETQEGAEARSEAQCQWAIRRVLELLKQGRYDSDASVSLMIL